MRGRRVIASMVLLVVILALAHQPATGEVATTVPQVSAPTERPAGDDLDGDGGSPWVFAVLSVLGGATALAILAGQWIRTRPPPRHRSD